MPASAGPAKSHSYFDEKPFRNSTEEVRGFVPGAHVWTTFSGNGKSMLMQGNGIPTPAPEISVQEVECTSCDGLGGHACSYCDDEKVCVHYETCDDCNGTGFAFS